MSLPSPAPSPNNTQDPQAQVEAKLFELAQDLYEMEVFAGDVVAGKENKVPETLAKVNQHFIDLSNMAPQLTETVPRTVVEKIDKFSNPHQYTKTALSRATGENQYALGRVLGLESFRRQLESAVGDSFPGVPLPERRHKPLTAEGAEDGQANGDHQDDHAQNGALDVEPKTEA